MKEFSVLLGTSPEALKIFVIGCFAISGLVIFIVASKMGWLESFSASKEKGITFEGKKATEKIFESGNINKLMDDQIHKLDNEMLDYALERSNNIRRMLSKQLNTKIYCASSRRALAACLRYPLYEASRRNNFKYVLRPENIKSYIDRVMRELSSEYDEFAIELENNVCPVDGVKNCKQLPPLADVFEDVKSQLVEQWAIPIRQEQVRMHYSKISTYKQFMPSFEQLGDKVRVKVCENCIEKNTQYAEALKRKPEVNEL